MLWKYLPKNWIANWSFLEQKAKNAPEKSLHQLTIYNYQDKAVLLINVLCVNSQRIY